MKKVLFVLLGILLVVGCGQKDIKYDSDYFKSSSYSTIYKDLKSISNNAMYIPTEDTERHFSQMITSIKSNYTLFTKEELGDLYDLINNGYTFKYSLDNYDNDDYNNDLFIISGYLNN